MHFARSYTIMCWLKPTGSGFEGLVCIWARAVLYTTQANGKKASTLTNADLHVGFDGSKSVSVRSCE
jgi:hypothetical protein